MNRGLHTSTCFGAIALITFAALFSSCDRRSAKGPDDGLTPQAKAYLEQAAENEIANTKKGWVHVEGQGFHYAKPKGWNESKDMEKGRYFQLTSPKKSVIIRLTSRYIESIPEGVHDLRDWAKLQYTSMGMPEALEETRRIEVPVGEALEARIKIGESHMRARYFVDMFQHPGNKRMWLLLVESREKSLLDATEVRDFLDSFRVENFRWLEQEEP